MNVAENQIPREDLLGLDGWLEVLGAKHSYVVNAEYSTLEVTKMPWDHVTSTFSWTFIA